MNMVFFAMRLLFAVLSWDIYCSFKNGEEAHLIEPEIIMREVSLPPKVVCLLPKDARGQVSGIVKGRVIKVSKFSELLNESSQSL